MGKKMNEQPIYDYLVSRMGEYYDRIQVDFNQEVKDLAQIMWVNKNNSGCNDATSGNNIGTDLFIDIDDNVTTNLRVTIDDEICCKGHYGQVFNRLEELFELCLIQQIVNWGLGQFEKDLKSKDLKKSLSNAFYNAIGVDICTGKYTGQKKTFLDESQLDPYYLIKCIMIEISTVSNALMPSFLSAIKYCDKQNRYENMHKMVRESVSSNRSIDAKEPTRVLTECLKYVLKFSQKEHRSYLKIQDSYAKIDDENRPWAFGKQYSYADSQIEEKLLDVYRFYLNQCFKMNKTKNLSTQSLQHITELEYFEGSHRFAPDNMLEAIENAENIKNSTEDLLFSAPYNTAINAFLLWRGTALKTSRYQTFNNAFGFRRNFINWKIDRDIDVIAEYEENLYANNSAAQRSVSNAKADFLVLNKFRKKTVKKVEKRTAILLCIYDKLNLKLEELLKSLTIEWDSLPDFGETEHLCLDYINWKYCVAKNGEFPSYSKLSWIDMLDYDRCIHQFHQEREKAQKLENSFS